MLFHSKYSLFARYVRPEIPVYHEVTGVKIKEAQMLVAEFGQVRGEFTFQNHLTGGIDKAADIVGGYFDSDIAAEQNNWSPEEKESVETDLLRLCQTTPFQIQLVEREAPVPEKPWASYDEAENGKIAELAEALNLVPQALAYEEATTMRSTVIRRLRDKLEQAQPVEEEELVASG